MKSYAFIFLLLRLPFVMLRPNLFLLDDDMRRLAPAHPRIFDGTPRVWPVRPMLGRATAVMSNNIRYMDDSGRLL